jgi:hypothetical protein
MSNRFLNAILAIAKLAGLAAKQSLRGGVGAVLSIVLLVLATGNAYALSAACTAINNEWSSGPLVTNQVFKSYNISEFDGTETITWSVANASNLLVMFSKPENFDGTFLRASGSFSVPTGSQVLIVTAGERGPMPGPFSGNLTITCNGASNPALTSLSPTTGSTAGGYDVTLNGTDLTGVTGVTFGGAAATITSKTATSLVVTAPAASAGFVDVEISDGAATSSLMNGFKFIAAPTFTISPSGGALPAATVGSVYSEGFYPSIYPGVYAIALVSGALPPGLSLYDTPTGTIPNIAGEPTSPGPYSFTLNFTNSANQTVQGSYTINVSSGQQQPSFTFTPTTGSTLPTAMAGQAYSTDIAATGGTGTLVYTLSNTAPAGLVINSATGTLSGTLDQNTAGSHTFSVTVTDSNSASATATYNLVVSEQAISAPNKVKDVPAGSTPTNVLLTDGATGGPFTDALVAYVQPASAGKAQIVMGEFAASTPAFTPGTFYLKFTPSVGYSGQAVVGYTLVSSLGTSNTGTVTYNLGIDANKVVSQIDSLLHGFLGARRGMIASSIDLPNLANRRNLSGETSPFAGSLTPNSDGMLMSFATSIVQANAAAAAANGVVNVEPSSPFNVWVNGTVKLHNNAQSGDRWGSFVMLSLGADYLVNDKALVGLSFHLDRMNNPTDQDAELTGNGWLAGPYASLEIAQGVFLDASLLYGGSNNTIDTTFFDGTFDTTRWMFDASISGDWKIDEVTTLTPRLRTVYLSETVSAYTVSNGAGTSLIIDGFTEDQFRASLGAELKRQFTLENGLKLTPKVGATVGATTLSGAGLFGALSAGLNLADMGGWMLDTEVLLNLDNQGAKSAGAKASFRQQF